MREQVSVRTMITAIYGPSLVYCVGQGAVIPVIALTARDLGASVAVAGLVAALAGVGQIMGAAPAAALAGRLGERNAMLVACSVAALGLAGCLLAPSVWVFAVGIFGTGLATSVWHLARLTFVADTVPFHYRGRALSTLGGVQRVGMFLGPFVGAGVMHLTGGKGAYWVYLAAALAAGGLLLMVNDVSSHQRSEPAPMLSVLKEHWPVLRTGGLTVLLFGAVRASRQVVLPLWADHIGLDATAASLVYGVSGAVDMLLFYPAGKVMDRFGRLWIAVPSMLLLGVAHLLLPLTHRPLTLLAVGIVMGLGNGISAGIVMTLGADAAPASGRAAFLGAWRLASDMGTAAGPLAVSAVTGALALGPAVLAMGGVALVAVVALHRWVPRASDAPAPAKSG